jgi:hypothetical protein
LGSSPRLAGPPGEDRRRHCWATWPARALGAAMGILPLLSDKEREIIRVSAALWAD